MKDARRRLAEALAEKFTSDVGARNREWDIDGPDDDTNPYYLTVPMDERVARQPYVHFIAGDGYPSFRAATIPELVEAIMPVVDELAREANPLNTRVREDPDFRPYWLDDDGETS